MAMSIDVNNFVSLPPSSSSIRVWHLLCHTNKEVCRLLTSQNDTKHGTTTFPVSDDAWRFLHKKIESATKGTIMRQRTRVFIMPNLSRCAMFDRRVQICYARINHAADLVSLHLCFGEVFGVGLPKHSGRPSRANPTTYAHHGDNINILHLSDDDDDDVMDEDGEDIFCKRTAAQGIDFYYDKATGTLRLRIRYLSHVISDEVVQQVLPGAGIAVAGKLDKI
jgi:hypothetical protein